MDVDAGSFEGVQAGRHPARVDKVSPVPDEDGFGLDDVVLDTPGTATISLTRRTPAASRPRWTTRSTELATVGTTKRAEMFSPASRGNVQS